MTQPADVSTIRATGLLANVAAWTITFAALAVWGMRRGQERV